MLLPQLEGLPYEIAGSKLRRCGATTAGAAVGSVSPSLHRRRLGLRRGFLGLVLARCIGLLLLLGPVAIELGVEFVVSRDRSC